MSYAGLPGSGHAQGMRNLTSDITMGVRQVQSHIPQRLKPGKNPYPLHDLDGSPMTTGHKAGDKRKIDSVAPSNTQTSGAANSSLANRNAAGTSAPSVAAPSIRQEAETPMNAPTPHFQAANNPAYPAMFGRLETAGRSALGGLEAVGNAAGSAGSAAAGWGSRQGASFTAAMGKNGAEEEAYNKANGYTTPSLGRVIGEGARMVDNAISGTVSGAFSALVSGAGKILGGVQAHVMPDTPPTAPPNNTPTQRPDNATSTSNVTQVEEEGMNNSTQEANNNQTGWGNNTNTNTNSTGEGGKGKGKGKGKGSSAYRSGAGGGQYAGRTSGKGYGGGWWSEEAFPDKGKGKGSDGGQSSWWDSAKEAGSQGWQKFQDTFNQIGKVNPDGEQDMNDIQEQERATMTSLAPMLPVAGSDLFEDTDKMCELKEQNLMMGQSVPPNWPLGNLDNKIWLQNMANQGLREMDPLFPMPVIYQGSNMTEGAALYGSYPMIPPNSGNWQQAMLNAPVYSNFAKRIRSK